MKTPVPPPAPRAELLRNLADRGMLARVLAEPGLSVDQGYHPWEWFFRHESPKGFTREDWWAAVRIARAQNARSTPFTMKDGTPLTYNLPDPLLRLIDDVSARARGQVQVAEPVANTANRDAYLVRSLVEEAITSSQLEGASTSRVRAKEMLREGRAPRDRSERMIANNYQAMQRIADLKNEALTPDLVREVHRIVTDGTLDDPADAGRLQVPGDSRVRVYGTITEEQVLHVPPAAVELPERLEGLCAFANAVDEVSSKGTYMPPLLRAITLHFMMGYDHYFADGNGRTSRAVFYWSMLHQGFFLTEFLSISRLLRKAPAQYARSFLLTEQDEGDLTYFFLAQAQVIAKAIDELDTYLADKSRRVREAARLLCDLGLNHRQVVVVESFLRDPGASATVESHRAAFGVVPQTARTDLRDLEDRGLLRSNRLGRRVVWFPAPDLGGKVRA
ncbi:Fic/DOC family [Actinomyces bovis]|uniref:Fic/DOC family n=1 Tax=Actinomyces bovis TaxID=1658 RepID=A0ABY1VR10_9ACTO|nr:Fic family protein [Actinomyces bovis]SPT55017.1 Fic/DOC family [Actinomyces bovis]VEG56154.1 Fic/DOC family [Actinomyces israelii]